MREERKCDCFLILFTAFITFVFTIVSLVYTSTDQTALGMLAALNIVAVGIFYTLCR